jgi:hypothetical protein
VRLETKSVCSTRGCVAAALLLFPCLSQTQTSPGPAPVPTIVFKVLHVYDSPGSWSGIMEIDQPIDVVVLRTTSGGFKDGQPLTLGIPVVYPSVLFDRKNVALSPKYLSAGKSFLVRDRGGCFFPPHLLHLSDNGVEKRIEASGFTLDPSCIEPISDRPVAR